MITILYFASLREQIGRSSDSLEFIDQLSVYQVWQQATGLDNFTDNLLVAVNQEYASSETILNDGDEVAFFPPVTGG